MVVLKGGHNHAINSPPGLLGLMVESLLNGNRRHAAYLEVITDRRKRLACPIEYPMGRRKTLLRNQMHSSKSLSSPHFLLTLFPHVVEMLLGVRLAIPADGTDI